MALQPSQQSSRLFKKSLGVAETITTKEFFSEAKLGRNAILPTQIWAEADLIPTTAPVLSDGQSTGVTEYHYQLPLTFIPGSISGSRDVSYSGATLKDAIPFNYGDGASYGYKLFTNAGVSIADGVGDWLVDGEAGVLTFYTPANMPALISSAAPPKISFYKYIGAKGLIASGVTTDVTSLSTALYQESTGRTSVDNSLSTAISGVSSSQIVLSTSVSTSISELISTDTVISETLSTEVSNREAADLTFLKLSGGTMQGLIDMNGYQIVVNVDPAGQYDLTNKKYVDAIAQGVAIHAPVHVVATSLITLSGSPQTIDGHSVISGEFVLATAQGTSVSDPNSKFNGIYVVGGGTWLRRSDADGQPTNEIELGDFVFVQSGVTNANTGWAIGDTNAPSAQTYISTGDTQMWFKMAAPGTYTANGEGLKASGGTTFYIDLSGNTLYQDVFGLKLSDGLSTAISSNTSNVSNLQSSVSTNASNISNLQTSVSTVASNISNLQTSVSTNTSDIAVLSGASDSLSTAISTNTYNITVISGATASLSTVVSSTNSTLSTNVSSLTSSDQSLSTSITGITSSVTSLSSLVSGQISDLVSTDVILSTIITGITSNITSLSTAVSVLSSTDTSLSSALTGSTSNINSLSTAISQLISTDNSLSLSITGLTSSDVSLSIVISNILTGYTSADASLSTAISNVVTGYTSADTSLSSALSTSNSGLTSLSTLLSTVISGNTYDDTSLSTAIKNEISDRTSVDQSLSSAITGQTSVDVSLSTKISTEISTEVSLRTSADSSLMTVINNLSGVTAQTAGSGLTYNATEKSLNVNVDNWTIAIKNDILVGALQWIQTSTSVNVSGVTSGYTNMTLAYNPVTPVSAYVNGVEYLVNPATNPAANKPFFYNVYPPVVGTQIWYDPTTAGFDIITGIDLVTIKYNTVDNLV